MATFSCYTDPVDFLNNSTAGIQVETASLVGGNTTLSASCTTGATSLSATSGTGFSGTFQLWILDGPNSESISGCTISGTTITVPSPGTAYAHAAGVSISSAGTAGCLAATIARASSTIDSICRQGPDGATDRTLWNKSRTEKLTGPNGWRANIDGDRSLVLRPYRYPVTSVTSVSLQMSAQAASTIDLTYEWSGDAQRLIVVPWASIAATNMPQQMLWPANPFPRNVGFIVTLVYTAGPIIGATTDSVPFDIKDAVYLLIQDRLADRLNPQGAAMVKRGDVTFEAVVRGDTSGQSVLMKKARELLIPYIQR